MAQSPSHNNVSTLTRSNSQTGCQECALSPVCLPPALEEGDLDQLESIINRPRPLARGQVLFHQGDPFTAIYAVRAGAIKTSVTQSDGTEHITGLYLAGEVVGLDAVNKDQHSSTATALDNTALCVIPFDSLEGLAAHQPGLQHHLFRLFSQEIQSDQQMLLLLGKRQAEARLAAFLIGLASRFSRRQLSATEFTLPMSRTDIANHLGLTIETVSRLFSRLEQAGLIHTEGRELQILDREALFRLADPAAERADEAATRLR